LRFAACASGLAFRPGPCRQARLGWQRLQGQQRAAGASRVAGCEALLRLEGPARTMRGVPPPAAVTFPGVGACGACLTVWSSRTGAAAGVTAGTACGRSPGPPGAAARRAAGLPPGGRDGSCRPAYGASPGPDPGRPRRRTLAFISPAISRARYSCSTSRPSGPARLGAPLKAVEKVVTGPFGRVSGG
jgi:hypothetical protein